MTGVPAESEGEMPIRRMIEAFVEQLTVFTEMRDAIHKLYTSGQFAFQGGYSERHPFDLDGLAQLRAALARLEKQNADWDAIQVHHHCG